VAETITAAADPEANIIFGATINPDLEGEIIVTVVATGFDESYYASRDVKAAELLRRAAAREDAVLADNKIDDAAMKDLDMELKDDNLPAEDFHSEETPNIWALPDEGSPVSAESAEDELEKPSFLRRLTKRGGKADDIDLASFGDDTAKTHTPAAGSSASSDNDDDDKSNPLHGEKPIPNSDELSGSKDKKDQKSKSDKG
jgi:hypothetical protein